MPQLHVHQVTPPLLCCPLFCFPPGSRLRRAVPCSLLTAPCCWQVPQRVHPSHRAYLLSLPVFQLRRRVVGRNRNGQVQRQLHRCGLLLPGVGGQDDSPVSELISRL